MKLRKPSAFKRRRLSVHQHDGMDPEVMYFRCTRCKRLVCGWCQGAADAHPGLCDPCWSETPAGRKEARR